MATLYPETGLPWYGFRKLSTEKDIADLDTDEATGFLTVRVLL